MASGGNGLAPSVLALFTTSWTAAELRGGARHRATVLGVVDVTGRVRPPSVSDDKRVTAASSRVGAPGVDDERPPAGGECLGECQPEAL